MCLNGRENPRTLALNPCVAPALRAQGQDRWLGDHCFPNCEELLYSWCNADLTCFCLEQYLPFLPQVFSV